MLFFGMICVSISDLRALESWCIKTDGSTLTKDSSVPLMHQDPSDLGSSTLIGIIPEERILSVWLVKQQFSTYFVINLLLLEMTSVRIASACFVVPSYTKRTRVLPRHSDQSAKCTCKLPPRHCHQQLNISCRR